MADFYTSVIGVIFALIASFCFNFAVIFQKKGLQSLPEINFNEGIKSAFIILWKYLRNRDWFIGSLLGILGCIPYLSAIEMIGILAVQPLTMTGLIAFIFATRYLLNEKIKSIEYIAIFFLISSPLLIIFSGIYKSSFTLNQILLPFLVFLIILIICFFFFLLFERKVKKNSLKSIFLVIDAAILGSLGVVFVNIFLIALKEAKIQLNFLGFIEILFGIFWFDSTHFFLFILFWGIFILNSISFFFLQNAFKKGNVAIARPISNCIYLILPIIAGFFIFNQRCDNLYLFITSICLTTMSVIVLSKFQSKIQFDEISY